MSTDADVRAAQERRYGAVIEDRKFGTGEGFDVPAGLDVETEALLERSLKLPLTRGFEFQKIRDFHENENGAAVSQKYFPVGGKQNARVWERNKRLLTLVQLVAPVVRSFTAAVYGGSAMRSATGMWGDALNEWMRSPEYQLDVWDWCDNASLFGTQVMVPYTDEDGIDRVWMPDAVSTWVYTGRDVWDVTAVVERTATRIQWISKWSEGWLAIDGTGSWTEQDFGALPVAIGYGVDRRKRGLVYGLPLVRGAVDWSARATAVAFNVSLMQTQQTRSILKRVGDLELLDQTNVGRPTEGNDGPSSMDLPAGFTAEFISPDPKIRESLDILRSYIGFEATGDGVPADVLDATLTEGQQSAESARIRAIPLVQVSQRRVPQWVEYEKALHLARVARWRYDATGAPVSARELRDEVQTTVVLTPRVIPMSPNEKTSTAIADLNSGLRTPEDVFREMNPEKSEDEIAAMAAEWRERQTHGQATVDDVDRVDDVDAVTGRTDTHA